MSINIGLHQYIDIMYKCSSITSAISEINFCHPNLNNNFHYFLDTDTMKEVETFTVLLDKFWMNKIYPIFKKKCTQSVSLVVLLLLIYNKQLSFKFSQKCCVSLSKKKIRFHKMLTSTTAGIIFIHS